MKQILFLAAASLILFACNKDDNREIPDAPKPIDGIVFELSTQSEAEDGLNTKRPIYSQDSLQSVDTVTIFAFKNSGSNYVYTQSFGVPGWTAGTIQKSYTIPSASLTAGDYKFLVVGVEKSSAITTTIPIVNITNFQDFTAAVLTNNAANEIFSGNQQATVTANEGFRVQVNMTRKAAGLLAYFVNVPSTFNGQVVSFLSIQLNRSSLSVNLTTGAGGQRTLLPNEAIRVSFAGIGINPDGTYIGNAAIAGVVQLPNSQLNGQFLFPVTGVTMTVQLLNGLSLPLKTWNVVSGGSTTFDIIANNFYSLGRKVKNDSTDGGTPGVPGDDDSAIDLLKDQAINITISPAWSVLHNLVIQ